MISDRLRSIIRHRAKGCRATVEALNLNRPEIINLRKLLISEGEHPPKINEGLLICKYKK